MIRLYAVRTGELPGREALLGRLSLDVGGKRRALEALPEARAVESLAGLLLLQAVLCAHGLPVNGQRLAAAPGGRPYLPDEPRADWNLTHTAGFAVCAWEWDPLGAPRVGVDAEHRGARDRARMERVAARWFTAGERTYLYHGQPVPAVSADAPENRFAAAGAEAFGEGEPAAILPEPYPGSRESRQDLAAASDFETRFLRIWTGKEAVVKWTGEGLAGIRGIDTVTRHPAAGAELCTYVLSDAVVTLCRRTGTEAPVSVQLLPTEELLGGL